MTCEHLKKTLDKVVVTSTSALAGAYNLVTDFDLATLTANADFILIIPPDKLAATTTNNPVVLTDGATTLPLEKDNGNNMRRSTFTPFVRRRAHCNEPALIRCFYGNDEEHVLVYPSRRY